MLVFINCKDRSRDLDLERNAVKKTKPVQGDNLYDTTLFTKNSPNSPFIYHKITTFAIQKIKLTH